jgi:nicotinamidase-related amidase
MSRLIRSEAFLVVIDVQEKLMPAIHDHEGIERNLDRLVRGMKVLDIPSILTEQYVQGLGPTVPSVRAAFEATSGYVPIGKMSFSAFGDPEFVTATRNLHRKQAIVAGIETHVCVYQTASDFLINGYEVTIVADAVSSRTAQNKEIAIRRLLSEGATISSTEMVLFELTVNSGTDEFREISRLIK